MSGTRASLFVAWRAIVRQPGRSFTAGAVGLVAMMFVSAALVLFTAINPSQQQLRANYTFNADVIYNYGSAADPTSADAALSALRDAVASRWGQSAIVSTSVLANDVSVAAVPNAGSPAARGTISYREYDTHAVDVSSAHTLIAGSWPERPGQVALSEGSAADLGVTVGDQVTLALSDNPVEVVSVFRTDLEHQARSLIAASGTWGELLAASGVTRSLAVLYQAYVIVPAENRALFTTDTDGLSNGAPVQAVPGFEQAGQRGVSVVSYAAQVPEFRPFWVRNVTAFTAPCVALLAVVIFAQQAVRARRETALASSLTALGFRRRDVTLVSATLGVIPNIGGIIAGTLLGYGLGLALTEPVAALTGTDASTSPPPTTVIGIAGIALLALAAVTGATVGWWTASRHDAATHAAGFTEAAAPAPPRTVNTALTVIGGCGVAALIAALLIPDVSWKALVVTALLSTAVLFLLPVLIAGASRIRPTWLLGWLAARLARAQQARVVALAFVVAAGIALPLGLSFLKTSYIEKAKEADRPRVPAGQVAVLTPEGAQDLAPDDITTLENAAGAPAVAIYEAQSTESANTAVPVIDGRPGPAISIVTDRAQADVFLGWSISDTDWASLTDGNGLWLSTAAPPTVAIGIAHQSKKSSEVTPTGATVPISTTSSPPNGSALARGPVLITTTTAESLGIPVRVAGYRFQNADARYAEIAAAAATLRIPGDLVRRYEPPPALSTPISFLTALIAVSLLVAAATFTLTWAGAREARRFDDTLEHLGMRHRGIRRLHLLITALTIGAGGVIGLFAGVGVANADLASTGGNVLLAASGNDVVTTVLAVVGISFAASLLATTIRHATVPPT